MGVPHPGKGEEALRAGGFMGVFLLGTLGFNAARFQLDVFGLLCHGTRTEIS